MSDYGTAGQDLGAHLLGRKHRPDARDWNVADLNLHALRSHPTPPDPDNGILDMTVRQVVEDTPYGKSWWGWLKLWHFLTGWFHKHPDPVPPTPTPPTPPSGDVPAWEDLIQLDQGQTGHCVGFGWAGWGDSAPVEDTFQNADGHAIYYECKVIDGEPKAEDGSEVRSGAKAMQQRHLLTAYAFSTSLAEINAWLDQHGPVVIGCDWTNDMFTPDMAGFVKPTGGVAGGHCFVLLDHDQARDAYLFQNSWGDTWGIGGRFWMSAADFGVLLAGIDSPGEACMALEVVH